MSSPRVLLTIGVPRSGSTVLERHIAQKMGLAAIGEVAHMWERGFRQNQLCSCGAPFHECLLWKFVVERIRGTYGTEHLFLEAIRSYDQVVSCYFLPLMQVRYSVKDETLFEARKLLHAIYEAVDEFTNGRVILDSSKTSAFAYLLAPSSNVNSLFLHLIRDSRAVVFSHQRVKRRPEIHWTEENMVSRRTRSVAINWNLQYLAPVLLYRHTHKRLLKVRYETFASQPTAVTNEIKRFLESHAFLAPD